jgi:hypothetical protein
MDIPQEIALRSEAGQVGLVVTKLEHRYRYHSTAVPRKYSSLRV